MEQRGSRQKTIPNSRQGHGVINPPDRPSVPTRIEDKLSVQLPTQRALDGYSENAQEVHVDVGHGREKIVFVAPASVREPLIAPFILKVGKRNITGGGGTSKEALRRARRKRNKKN